MDEELEEEKGSAIYTQIKQKKHMIEANNKHVQFVSYHILTPRNSYAELKLRD